MCISWIFISPMTQGPHYNLSSKFIHVCTGVLLFSSVGTTVAMKPEVLPFSCGLLFQIPLQLAWLCLGWPLQGPKEMNLFVGLLRTIQSKEYIE